MDRGDGAERLPSHDEDRRGDGVALAQASRLAGGPNRHHAAVWQGFNYHYICGPHRFGYLSAGVSRRDEWEAGMTMTPGCSGDFVSLRTAAQKLDLSGSRSFVWTARDRDVTTLSEEEEEEDETPMSAELLVGPIKMSCRGSPCEGFEPGPLVTGTFTAQATLVIPGNRLAPSPNPVAGVPAPRDFGLLQGFIQGVQVAIRMPEWEGPGCHGEKPTKAVAFERFACSVLRCEPEGTGVRVVVSATFEPGCIMRGADANQSVTREGIFFVVRLRVGVFGTQDASVTEVRMSSTRTLESQEDPLRCGGPPYPFGVVGGSRRTTSVAFETMEPTEKLPPLDPPRPALVAVPTSFSVDLMKFQDGTPFGTGGGFVVRDFGFEICGMRRAEFRGYGPSVAGAQTLRWRADLRRLLSFSNLGNYSAAGEAALELGVAVLAIPGATNLGPFGVDEDEFLLEDQGGSGCRPNVARAAAAAGDFADRDGADIPLFASDCRPNVSYCIPGLLPPPPPGLSPEHLISRASASLLGCMGYGGLPQVIPRHFVGSEHE